MDRKRIIKVAGAILAISGTVLLYPAVILGVTFGLDVLLLAVLMAWIIVLSGLSLRFNISLKHYVTLMFSGVGITVSVGLIFSTLFQLELKLVLFNVFLLVFIFAIWLLRRKT